MNIAVAVCLLKLELAHSIFVERYSIVVARSRREPPEHEPFRFLVEHDCGLDCARSNYASFGVLSDDFPVVFPRSSRER